MLTKVKRNCCGSYKRGLAGFLVELVIHVSETLL